MRTLGPMDPILPTQRLTGIPMTGHPRPGSPTPGLLLERKPLPARVMPARRVPARPGESVVLPRPAAFARSREKR